MTAVLYGCSYRLRKHRWPQATPNGHRIRYHMSFTGVYFGWLTLKSYPSNAVQIHRHIIVFWADELIWWAYLIKWSNDIMMQPLSDGCWLSLTSATDWRNQFFEVDFVGQPCNLSAIRLKPISSALSHNRIISLFCLSWCLSTLWALRKSVAEMAKDWQCEGSDRLCKHHSYP